MSFFMDVKSFPTHSQHSNKVDVIPRGSKMYKKHGGTGRLGETRQVRGGSEKREESEGRARNFPAIPHRFCACERTILILFLLFSFLSYNREETMANKLGLLCDAGIPKPRSWVSCGKQSCESTQCSSPTSRKDVDRGVRSNWVGDCDCWYGRHVG